ncbi:hypothetical protein [Streptomyces sp. RPT161]|uniref:hypothetical protein n=1 Tax=Streptomyces sp. RPT161 TaxID=3015993 RepID=UPI0022B8CB2F|nr:hypothetical protein [Streptomyces sp. RPT161]
MIEAFRLQMHYDKRANRVRCRVVLAGDTVDATARIASEALRAGRSDGSSVPICVVHPTSHNAKTDVLIEGPPISLLPVHAKARRAGYCAAPESPPSGS